MTIHPEVIALLPPLATGKPRVSQESSHDFSTINRSYRNFSSALMQINNLVAYSPQSRLNRRCQMQVERESTEPIENGHDAETGTFGAGARSDRGARRDLQSHAGKIPARARGVFSAHLAKYRRGRGTETILVLIVHRAMPGNGQMARRSTTGGE